MVIAAKTSLLLSNLGYVVDGIVPRGDEAVAHVKSNNVDIILLDIHLKGKMDGIETAMEIQKFSDCPIIFLTANADEATFNRAKSAKPSAFLSKPFKQLELQRAIELAICRMAPENENCDDNFLVADHPVILNDRIFVRNGDRMIKVMADDILYIEADRNYSRIFTAKKEFLLTLTLKAIEGKLSFETFVRTHRSYIINICRIDEVAGSYVVIGGKPVPLSAAMRENLMNKIQTL